jgi:hypothetical protein
MMKPILITALALCALFQMAAATIILAGVTDGLAFDEFIDPNPAPGNRFGFHVVALSSGNVVITSPYDDAGGTDAGAAYLFNGATGALISTVTGSAANDNVGLDGVIALATGNYLILSNNWHPTGDSTAALGAVTFGNGITGVSGVVDAANSLVGSTVGDRVGISGVTALADGSYIICSASWDNGAIVNAGAATFGNGITGIVGPVTTANSLYGTNPNDFVGALGAVALTNGNYVVISSFWGGGIADRIGAVTLGNRLTGLTGPVSPANSLVGSTANDYVGQDGVTILSNGNFVVNSRSWHHGSTINAGAVTWVDGAAGLTGPVTALNSLHGTSENDSASRVVVALSNGNYVVGSQQWDNGGIGDAGAVTFGNGSTGTSGAITTANSLHGSKAGELVGEKITALTNGNYVVRTLNFDLGGSTGVGAATWGSGTTGIVGPVTIANSLHGSTPSDFIGSSIVALANGNYAVLSPRWNQNLGAVTWADGSTGLTGPVTTTNSLHGTTPSDLTNVRVTALTNGNYVVAARLWDNAANANAGASIFADGSTGIVGPITTANSLHGTVADGFPLDEIIPLSNGDYLINAFTTSIAGVSNAGTVTLINGTTGLTGEVTAANSLHGASDFDFLGVAGGSTEIAELSNGNYVVPARQFDHAGLSDVGAYILVDRSTGSPGAVRIEDSILGKEEGAGFSMRGVVEDTVNGTFFGIFFLEDNGKVRVGSSGPRRVPPVFTGGGTDGTAGLQIQRPLRFAATKVGAASRTQTLLISNVGGQTAAGLRLVVKGAARSDFNVVQPFSTTLAPGASTTFQATFRPKRSGVRRATVSVLSSASPASALLNGRGESKSTGSPRFPAKR